VAIAGDTGAVAAKVSAVRLSRHSPTSWATRSAWRTAGCTHPSLRTLVLNVSRWGKTRMDARNSPPRAT